MDRRQIRDVEAELRDAGEELGGIGEGAVTARFSSRPRKELIPGREASELAIDGDGQLAAEASEVRGFVVRDHQRGEMRVERALHLLVDRYFATVLEDARGLDQRRASRRYSNTASGTAYDAR